MDKSKLAWAAIILNSFYSLVGLISIICGDIYSALFHSSRDLAMFFYHISSAINPFALLVMPLFFVPAHIVLSLIGLIKNKKLFPYLFLPVIPVIIWLFVFVTAARYI